MFLKDSWISTLKVAMRSSLRDMSKGWYNLYENNWEVYLMSKLRKLMELIKYMLQDTLRFLVQDSLTSFSQFISDACCSVLDCSEDMEWGEDFINSPYRWAPWAEAPVDTRTIPCQAPVARVVQGVGTKGTRVRVPITARSWTTGRSWLPPWLLASVLACIASVTFILAAGEGDKADSGVHS